MTSGDATNTSLGLCQGLILAFIYFTIENANWPATSPYLLTSLLTFTVVSPLLFLLISEPVKLRRSLIITISYGAVVAGIATVSIGPEFDSAKIDVQQFQSSALIVTFIMTMILAGLKASVYLQQFVCQTGYNYETMFTASWRNILLVLGGLTFCALLWIVLVLAAILFHLINLLILSELLRNPWVAVPLTTTAFALAIGRLRQVIYVLDNISSLIQLLCQYLLPMLIGVSLFFLMAILLTGTDTLYQNGLGTWQLLWLQGLTLLLLNAVYQDKTKGPYSRRLELFIMAGIILLPVYSGFAWYGLSIRVEQYGLSLLRLWGGYFTGIFGLFSLGYALIIVQYRLAWRSSLPKVNIRIGGLLWLSLLILHLPQLNFFTLTAHSQVARLNNGSQSVTNFDWQYFKQTLGKPGYDALQEVRKKRPNSPEANKITELYTNTRVSSEKSLQDDIQNMRELTIDYTKGHKTPSFINSTMVGYLRQNNYFGEMPVGYHSFYLNVDEIGQNEYIIIVEYQNFAMPYLVFARSNKWEVVRMEYDASHTLKTQLQSLKQQDLKLIQPRWQDIQLKDLRLSVPYVRL